MAPRRREQTARPEAAAQPKAAAQRSAAAQKNVTAQREARARLNIRTLRTGVLRLRTKRVWCIHDLFPSPFNLVASTFKKETSSIHDFWFDWLAKIALSEPQI